MKARPRRNENRVAEELSKWFEKYGFAPVERIPILGREGPDITTNKLKIIIDAKSRKQTPKSYMVSGVGILTDGKLIGVRLRDLDLLLDQTKTVRIIPPSKTVGRWFDHMKEWQENEVPDGIPALVLHRPGKNVDNATFVIRESDREVLSGRIRN